MSQPGMDTAREIAQALGIGLEEEGDQPQKVNSYQSNDDGKITHLTLSDLHFENFDALAPVFKTLKTLTLIQCTIDDVQALVLLEKVNALTLDNVTFKRGDSKTDRPEGRHDLGRLTLSNLHLENFEALASIIRRVHYLNFVNCTIDDLSVLLHIEYVECLTLDQVVLTAGFQASAQPADTVITHFQFVDFKNMEVTHPGCLLPLAKQVQYLGFTRCRVRHFQELNLLPALYHLTLNDSQFIPSPDDVLYEVHPDSNCIFLIFENMQLDDFSLFLPVADNVSILHLDHCVVKSLASIGQFPDLETLRIDASTQVETVETPAKHPSSSFLLEVCEIKDDSISKWDDVTTTPVFNLESLTSIASHIKRLDFVRYQPGNPQLLKSFTALSELRFERAEINLNHFLPAAHQVRSISLEQSTLNHKEAFQHFKQLERFAIRTYHEAKLLGDFKELLPLKDHLKELDLDEEGLKNLATIQEFTALESLNLTVKSTETAQHVLSLPSLKKLVLYIDPDPVPKGPLTLDLKALESMENLTLSCYTEVAFKGMEHLDCLKRLHLEGDCTIEGLPHLKNLESLSIESGIDINTVPTMESLKVLDIDADYEVHGLEQFPNLEKLRIQASNHIHLGRLAKLKILILQWIDLDTTRCFENLPNLEQLDLTYNELTTIKNLDRLTNLRMLDLSDNEIENLDGLANLKNLEQLNLSGNQVSDISVLNSLPNLKGVNIPGNKMGRKEAQQQLANPEIVEYLGGPYRPFSIRID